LTGQKGIPRRTICGILPIETFRMGTMNIGSGGEAGIVNQYLQYQVFSDNINDYTSVGNKQMICGFRFSFTDRIHLEYTPNNIKQNNPDGIGKNGD
jgi:hypothetical protein